jgi:hypothetical protein
MAQLIPVFLIALFVLDNTWLERIAERYRREAMEALEEAKDVVKQRSSNESFIEDSMKQADEVFENHGRQRLPIKVRRRKSIKRRSLALASRGRLAAASEEYREAIKRTDAARERVIGSLQRYAFSPLPPCYFLSRCVTGGGQGCAHAGSGGIQGFPVRAPRIAVITSVPCLRAVSR